MKKLTYPKAIILAFLASFIFTTMIWSAESSNLAPIINPILLFIIILGFFTIVFYALIIAIFIGPREEEEYYNEKIETAKKEVLSEYNLTKEAYTEVKFIFEELLSDVDEDLTDVLIPLLNNSNYRYFAKLIDVEKNEAIELLAKDMYDNNILTLTISNFLYFQTNFEKLN